MMSENENKVGVTLTSLARARASGPILLLAGLFIIAVFLSWYFTWFGRGLSDSEITKYLDDEKHPRHVQHALLQVQEHLEKGDYDSARQWYPRILSLAGNSETEFRLTVAWLMGSDNRSDEFHQALRKLVNDPEPIVRRNAALALLRFNDSSGREELRAVLAPFTLKAPQPGVVASTLHSGSVLSRGTLLARIQGDNGSVAELRSPLPGKIEKIIAANGIQVATGDALLTIASDDGSIWEALRGLALVGEANDLPAVELYARAEAPVSDRTREQAALTVKSIRARVKVSQ